MGGATLSRILVCSFRSVLRTLSKTSSFFCIEELMSYVTYRTAKRCLSTCWHNEQDMIRLTIILNVFLLTRRIASSGALGMHIELVLSVIGAAMLFVGLTAGGLMSTSLC